MTSHQVSFEAIRSQFPVLAHNTRQGTAGPQPLVYLDSAATSQKPQAVIDAMSRFLERDYGTVHRGAYELSVRSSQRYEEARGKAISLVTANPTGLQAVFTRGTTDSLNILAHGLSEAFITPESRIVTTVAEHHANLVPWQQEALRKDCELAYIPLRGKQGSSLALNLEKAKSLISKNTRVVTLAHVGNVLGQINPLAEIIALAKNAGAIVVVDSAQSIASLDDDLFTLGADAVAYSLHKMYGPSGIGVLVARESLLKQIPPMSFGGGMIADVTLEGSTWADAPAKFEAGTPMIVEAMGLNAAVEWITAIGRRNIHTHAAALATRFREELSRIPGIEIYSPATGEETVISFRHTSMHAHDLATILDGDNIAMRAGHHCAWPLIRFLGVDALIRASFAAYSSTDDVERAIESIRKAVRLF